KEKTDIKKVFPDVPKSILTFPVIKGSPFRDFRNAIFHCQWSPTLAKFQLDQTLTDKIEKLHHEIGTWIEAEFRTSYHLFAETYNPPKYWLFDDSFTEWMPESFY
ncbi:MAG TPA: hypothetical protein PK263_03555, partial [bacterium]|nr:hypothetical protein [bacterium]